MLRYLNINAVPRRLGTAVHRKMFWRRNDPQIFRIIPLQPGYEGHPHAPRKKGIFPVGLLAPSPTWIAEDVDIRGPEIQPLHNVPPSGADRKSTRLNSSHRCISYAVFCL